MESAQMGVLEMRNPPKRANPHSRIITPMKRISLMKKKCHGSKLQWVIIVRSIVSPTSNAGVQWKHHCLKRGVSAPGRL